MSEQVLFSIIVATYNGEKYIRDQLESILKAIDEGMSAEIVVSDNGSMDTTVDILESIKRTTLDIPIKIVFEDRRGVAQNFANGIRSSSGRYIVLSDQDDIWLPDKLKVLKDYIYRQPEVDLLAHSACTFGPASSGRVLRPKVSFGELFSIGCCLVVSRSLADEFLDVISEASDNKALLGVGHDRWLCTMASARCSFRVINDVLLLYRRHEQNASVLSNRLKRGITYKVYDLFFSPRAAFRIAERYEVMLLLRRLDTNFLRSPKMRVKFGFLFCLRSVYGLRLRSDV